MQKLGGSLGDGLLTASITTPAFVRYSKKNMEEGAAKAGKDASNLILGCVIVGSIGQDSKKGKKGAREQAAMYLANKVQNIKGSADVLLESAGITFEELQPVADAMERAGRKSAARLSATNSCARFVLSPARLRNAFRKSKNTETLAALTSCRDLGRRSHRSGEIIWRCGIASF